MAFMPDISIHATPPPLLIERQHCANRRLHLTSKALTHLLPGLQAADDIHACIAALFSSARRRKPSESLLLMTTVMSRRFHDELAKANTHYLGFLALLFSMGRRVRASAAH